MKTDKFPKLQTL